MTVAQILNELKPRKPITRETFYQYARRFKIKPLSKVRQHPQQYPADTPHRILFKLGLVNGRTTVKTKLTKSRN